MKSFDKRAGNLLSDYEIVWFVTWKSEKLNVIITCRLKFREKICIKVRKSLHTYLLITRL